jgi:hemoglobin
MKTLRTLAAAVVLAAISAAPAAYAQKPLPSPAGADPIEGESVYEAFHGKEGIARIMDDFVPRIVADPRIGHRFKDTNLDRLKLMLTAQVCYLVGGPCEYTGRDMTEVHKGLDLTNADFNALAEDLQISMDKEKVPFRAQNRLLARLAPMQRVIVTK